MKEDRCVNSGPDIAKPSKGLFSIHSNYIKLSVKPNSIQKNEICSTVLSVHHIFTFESFLHNLIFKKLLFIS